MSPVTALSIAPMGVTTPCLPTLLRVHQGTGYTQTSLPLGPFSGYTRGQTTQKQTSLPLGSFSGHTRGQTTQKLTSLPLGSFSGHTRGQTTHRQAFPWDSSQGIPGDRLHRSLPLGPFSGHTRGQTTQKPSPRTLLRAHQTTDYTHRQTFPWDSSQGTPGYRLHRYIRFDIMKRR